MGRPIRPRDHYTEEVGQLARMRRTIELDRRPEWKKRALDELDRLVRRLVEPREASADEGGR